MPNLSHVLQIGDVIFVEKVPNTNNIYRLQQIPKVEGAVVAMEPHTGRVLAMVGGFSFPPLNLIVQHKLIVNLALLLSLLYTQQHSIMDIHQLQLF